MMASSQMAALSRVAEKESAVAPARRGLVELWPVAEQSLPAARLARKVLKAASARKGVPLLVVVQSPSRVAPLPAAVQSPSRVVPPH